MQKKKHKVWGVLLIICIITALIGLVIQHNQNDFPIYYADSYIGSKYVNTIEINSVEDYLAFAGTVSDSNNYKDSLVVLNADLDFSECEDFPVIGLEMEDAVNVPFMGTFEGNGHVLSGIHVSNDNEETGMFAKLGGIVKNLRIENSSFSGSVCGAIAAENQNGSILNCYIEAKTDGETAGTAAGKNSAGIISNCVVSEAATGISEEGIETYCYTIEEYDIVALTENLVHLSGQYKDTSFNSWEETISIVLSEKKENLIETITTTIKVSDQELILNGYYSVSDEQWCFALPAGYYDEKLFIEAKTNHGDTVNFNRNKGEETAEFALGDTEYQVKFLTSENADTLYIVLDQNKGLDYVHLNKREEIPGRMLILESNGNATYKEIRGFYGHGNSSWEADKKSYNLKFDSYENLLEMGANDEFALLAGYRMNSLMSYGISNELSEEIGFDFVPEFRYVNLYVGGEYAGVYCLTEKIEIDTNRLEISSVYDETKSLNGQGMESFEQQVWKNSETEERRHYYNIEINPKDITGGYLLEMDFLDYSDGDSRFTTKYQRNKIVLKRAMYSSEAQVNYIADFWQDFEDALFSENGYNEKGKRYTEYIDLESFAMQWLMYELSKEDSMKSSIYYYKESDITGDGLIHACYPWDVERSYVSLDQQEQFGSVNGKSEYWGAFYQHEDFKEELARVWREKLVPAIELMIDEQPLETKSGLKNIRWYENNISDISSLENSRWEDCDMLKKCDTIRSILSVRKDVITEELLKYDTKQ